MNDDKQARYAAARDALIASLTAALAATVAGENVNGIEQGIAACVSDYTSARIVARGPRKAKS